MKNQSANKAIILFDGYCNLCSWAVRFIIKRDIKDYFRFASQQSETCKKLIETFNLWANDKQSVILIENNSVYLKSDAALRIVKKLRHLWPLAYVFIIIPKFIRDYMYECVARNRFNWFGKRNTCYIPRDNEQIKFL